MWVPPEDVDPILLHAPTRKSAGVFGAVCIGDGRLETQPSSRFDAEEFKRFLSALVRRRRRGCLLLVIVDNARYHHAKVIRPWLDKHRQVLRLDFLPAYSPDLNPMERAWKLTRRLCTHNRYFDNLDELCDAVFDKFDEWHEPNQTLKRLCAII